MHRNFPVLLSQGIFYTVAVQLTSAMAVIPFITAELDAPAIAVALLVPVYTIGTLFGNVFIAQILRWTSSVVVLLFGNVFLQAVLIILNALAVEFLPDNVSPYPLLITTAFIGVAAGFSRVIVSLSTAALLPSDRQGSLLVQQAGYGAVMVTLVSAYSAGFLSDESPGIDNAELLWVGAVAMIVSAICCIGLRPIRDVMPTERMRMGEVMVAGARLLRSAGWLRRYLVTQVAFTTITLGSVFYGIYSSESLGPDNGALDTILTFVGLGLLAGIWIWSHVRKRFDVRGMLVCSALIGMSAAVLTLVLIAFRPIPLVWTFGLAMMLTAIASQAVFPASHVWLEREVTDDERVVVLSFTQIVVSVVSIGIALVFGLIARHGLEVWPIAIMLALNVIAAMAAAGARVSQREEI
jgi:MFS family permease